MKIYFLLLRHSWPGPGILYLDLHCVLADIVLSLRLDPWSWPGMTVSESLVAFSGCLLVFRQKNIRT